MPPLVSVVLPTSNRARSLERAINSVLEQTLADLELIVVDDHSIDDTDEILRRLAADSRVRVVCSLRRGCASARNVGVMMARGRYVAFQDSDDEWLPTKLEKSIAALEADPGAAVVYTDLIAFNSQGRIGRFLPPNDIQLGVLISERTLDYQVYGVGIQSAVVRRDCFDVVGLFDEELCRFIDLDLFIRLADRYKFLHCRELLVRYDRTDHKDRITNDMQALVHARRRLLAKHRARLKQNRHHLAMQYFHLAVATRANGEWLPTAGYLARALATSPLAPIRTAVRELGGRWTALACRPSRRERTARS